jgi:hypothetical protein
MALSGSAVLFVPETLKIQFRPKPDLETHSLLAGHFDRGKVRLGSDLRI